jgi:OHCU decarboxylase
VARLRAHGELAGDPTSGPDAAAVGSFVAGTAGIARLGALSLDAARAALRRCCGSSAWAESMTAARPFEDLPALLRIAERVWWSLDEAAHREAFAAHPRIGESSEANTPATGDPAWSAGEQRGMAAAGAAITAELAQANRAYFDRHGFIFILCATGLSADAMLAELRARMPRALADELRTAAEEQIKITRLRLRKLMGELA